jgi:hypothetical protein
VVETTSCPFFPSSSTTTTFCQPSSSMSCHATLSIIIGRSGEGVTEWLRQPHVLSSLLLQRQRPTAFLPPSRAAFVSPHLFSLDDNGLAVIVFRLPSCSSLSYSRRVLSFVSSHFMYDEETEQTSDRSGSISCVKQEER